MSISIKSCYLDTNIILDYLRKRNEETLNFINLAKEKRITVVTSHFAIFEVLDLEAQDKFIFKELKNKKAFDEIRRNLRNRNLTKKELENIYKKIRKNLFYIDIPLKLHYLSVNGWDYSLKFLMKTINLESKDVLHLASAIEARCDVLITKDEIFKQNAKELIPAMTPKEFLKNLKELNINPKSKSNIKNQNAPEGL